MKIEPKLKNRLNFAGEIKINGKKVKAKSKKRHPTKNRAAKA
jgi:hypothetical protein